MPDELRDVTPTSSTGTLEAPAPEIVSNDDNSAPGVDPKEEASSTAAPTTAPGSAVPAADSKPDPVAEAINLLSRPRPGEEVKSKPSNDDPDSTTTPRTPDGKFAPKVEQTGPPATNTGIDDPLAGLDENTRRAIGNRGKVREFVDSLNAKIKDRDVQIKNVEQFATDGKQFNELIDNFGVRDDVGWVPPEHMAGLIRAQASVNRALDNLRRGQQPTTQDMQQVNALGASVDAIRQSLGVPVAKAESEITPFAGKLPEHLHDLVSVYGIPESQVRLLAAIEARTAQAAKAPVSAPAPVHPQLETSAVAPAQPVRTQPTAPTEVENAYMRRLTLGLSKEGINVEAAPKYISQLIEGARPKVREMFGVGDAQVPRLFNAMSASERYNLLLEVHRDAQAKQRPVPTQLPAATTNPPLNGRGPQRQTQRATDDPVQDAINRLSRSE